jgi:hypothetical protein
MGSLALDCRSGYTKKNSCAWYSKWIIKIQYRDLCLDLRRMNCTSVNIVKSKVSMMGFGLG